MSIHRPENYFGRNEEWDYLSRRITAKDKSTHVVCISGDGGVGKTALLETLREVYAGASPAYLLLSPLDFDDLSLRLPDSFMERIAEMLEHQRPGEAVFQLFRDLMQQEREGIQHQYEIQQALSEGLRTFTARRRVILLVDTVEKAPLWFPELFANVMKDVANIVVVLVGRPPSDLVPLDFVAEISRLHLPGFKSFEWVGLPVSLCEDYFESRQEFREFSPDRASLNLEFTLDLKKRIWHLARGIPFQVNLFISVLSYVEESAYQLKRDIRDLLNQIQRADIAGLEHDYDLRERFQQALVAPFVHSYNEPQVRDGKFDSLVLTSRILLLIAHINHYLAHTLGGFDASVLSDLDQTLSQSEVEEALRYIEEHRDTRFTFVKLYRDADGKIAGIGLHDEMVWMLNNAAWIRLDPPGSSAQIRREISRKLVSYYDQQCLALYPDEATKAKSDVPIEEAWIRAVNTAQGQTLLLARTFHSIYIDFKSSWHWIYNLSERIFKHAYFDVLLYNSVKHYLDFMHIVYSPDIRARMDVWNAASIVAQRNLPGKGVDLQHAIDLLESSITIWRRQYESDGKILELSDAHETLTVLRRAVEIEKEQNAYQRSQLQNVADVYTLQLTNIRLLTEDLERAYTTLGFAYRLTGNWANAIANYQNALKYSRWAHNLENIAELTNNIANVYLLWGKLTDASLYAQIGALIRKKLGARTALGNSYWVLGQINWRVGNTYECRQYLNLARECHPADDEVNQARIKLYEGYTYYRIGDTEIGHESMLRIPDFDQVPPVRSFKLLEEARQVFAEYEQLYYLSWTYNVLSRAYRRDGEFELSEESAKFALKYAQNSFQIAEAHLSLCMLYFRWGMRGLKSSAPDKQNTLEMFARVDQHHAQGYELAQRGPYIDMLSVYEGVKGNIEYERGMLEADPGRASEHYDRAFEHYRRECQIAARNKALRFERALNEVVADRLTRMPVDLALEYAGGLSDFESWESEGLVKEYQKLKGELDELKFFLGLPGKEYVDKLERDFNQHMRVGDYQEALEVARDSLQRFYRYTWNIETVRMLIKVAQAYRKIAKFTEARRYCKQALYICENLPGDIGGSVYAKLQKAHADFTMGRILWEIGNTAESATHFRLAREVYMEYRDYEDPADPTIGRQMREGLARSIQYEGFMRFRIGEFDQALEFLIWSENEYRAMKNRRRVAKVLNLKARIYRDRNLPGDAAKARSALDEAFELLSDIQDKYVLAEYYLSYMILEFQEGRHLQDKKRRLASLKRAESWYKKGHDYAYENRYTLLQSVYEGMLGNILFDRLQLEASEGEEVNLEPAFDQYLQELRWDTHFEKRRFFRSLDLLMRQLSLLNSSQIAHYIAYIQQKWEQMAADRLLVGENTDKPEIQHAEVEEYKNHMREFCRLLEVFGEYIACS